MNRFLLILFMAVFYASILGGSFLFWQDKFQASLVPPLLTQETNKEQITLLFVGDIMLDRGVEFYIKEHQDWKWPFLKIGNYLKGADLVFANLESIISDKGEKQGSIYSFRADPRTLEGLVFAGIDVVSVANNHSLDYGIEALLDSGERLQQAGITPVGAGNSEREARAPVLYDAGGTTVGILAYTALGSPFWQAGEKTPGIAWIDSSLLEQLKLNIKKTKQQADIVVVSFHFGEEYQTKPNAVQQLLSRTAIDAGANLVIGHHPHVIQPIERYKQGWIVYSLGNFVFDQGFSKETMEGMILKVLLHENSITQVMPLMIEISSEFQPAISTESM